MKKSYEVFKKKNLFSPALKNYILYSFEPILNELYGPECVAWMKPLLHYSGFYILKFDKNLNAQVIPQEFRIPRKKHLLRPPDDNHFWVTFFVIHNSNYGHCNDLDFITQTQIKHFELAGYTLIKVYIIFQLCYKKTQLSIFTDCFFIYR